MFDFSLTEIAVFGVVALLAIGPKDLPVAMRAVGNTLKKARKMASEFQGHVDEMMREANLGEVNDHLRDIRNFNIRDRITKVIDPDHSLGAMVADVNVPMYPDTVIARPDETDPVVFEAPPVQPAPVEYSVPEFIPPSCVRPPTPAFIPPGFSSHRR